MLADGSFSINVNGSDLRNDPTSTVNASFVATDAAGNFAVPVTDTETYTVNNAPDAIDDVGALNIAEDGTTAILNATMLAISRRLEITDQYINSASSINNSSFGTRPHDIRQYRMNNPLYCSVTS